MPLPPPQDPVRPGGGAAFVASIVGSGADVILVGGSEINGAFVKVLKDLVGEKDVVGPLQFP